jgi:hypothetical protein
MTPHAPTPEPDDQVESDAGELSGIFAVPDWLRGAGLTAWLLVGLTVLLVGLIWLLICVGAPASRREFVV